MIPFPNFKIVVQDYQDFLKELKEDLADHVLDQTDTIQILRDSTGLIEDWYYNKETMQADYQGMVEEYGNDFAVKAYQRYWRDLPRLETVKTGDAIEEIAGALHHWFKS